MSLFTRSELQAIRNKSFALMQMEWGRSGSPVGMAMKRVWSDLMAAADHAEATLARLELEASLKERGFPQAPGYPTLEDFEKLDPDWRCGE